MKSTLQRRPSVRKCALSSAGLLALTWGVFGCLSCSDTSCERTRTCPAQGQGGSSSGGSATGGNGNAGGDNSGGSPSGGSDGVLSPSGGNNTGGSATRGVPAVDCEAEGDCPAALPECSAGVCVCPLSAAQLEEDPDNCGSCGNVCEAALGTAQCLAGACVACGNGMPETGEQCDDGNSDETDECSSECMLSFRVLSVTPTEGDTQVDRVPTIELEFSAEIDPDSFTEASSLIVDDAGPVPGVVEISAAVLAFTPTRPLHLRSAVEVTLSSLQSVNGTPLDAAFSSSFQVRDGVLGPVLSLSGGAITSVDRFVRGNEQGDVLALWTTGTPASVRARVFDAQTATWTAAQDIENDGVTSFTTVRGTLDVQGNAFVHWRSNVGTLPQPVFWNRYTKGVGWGLVQQQTGPFQGTVGPEFFALQTDGTVMTLNRSSSNVVSDVLFSKLEPGSTTWTPEALLEASVDTASQDVFAFGEGFLGTFIRDTGVAAASTYLPVTGWELSAAVGLSGADNNGCAAVGTSQAVLFTALSAGTTFAGIYDGQSWSFDDLGANLCFGQASWSSGQGSVVGVGAGNDVQVALHASSTWSGSEMLGRVPANGFFLPGAAIDAAGQALAAWPTNDGTVADTALVGVAVRRYVPGLGWEAEQPLDVLAFETSVFADPLGGMTIVGYHSTPGLWWVRFE